MMIGSGRKCDPYAVSSVDDFLMMTSSSKNGEYYVLVDDIDLAGIDWESKPFRSTLYGGGYKIKNLGGYAPSFSGLFSVLQGARLFDVHIDGVNLLGLKKSPSDPPYIFGGLSARFQANTGVLIENCTIENISTTDSGFSGVQHVLAGIIGGYASPPTTNINQSYVRGSLVRNWIHESNNNAGQSSVNGLFGSCTYLSAEDVRIHGFRLNITGTGRVRVQYIGDAQITEGAEALDVTYRQTNPDGMAFFQATADSHLADFRVSGSVLVAGFNGDVSGIKFSGKMPVRGYSTLSFAFTADLFEGWVALGAGFSDDLENNPDLKKTACYALSGTLSGLNIQNPRRDFYEGNLLTASEMASSGPFSAWESIGTRWKPDIYPPELKPVVFEKAGKPPCDDVYHTKPIAIPFDLKKIPDVDRR